MTLAKPTFPAPDHDHGRCTADALHHAERVCAQRAQKFTPIRRHVLQALLSSHRPLGAYEVIDELAKSMPRPAPITVYRALDFLIENGLVHRIESRNAYLACAHDHDAAAMVAFLICERLRLGRRNSGGAGGARPQRRRARLRLCAENVGGRNHRHLRALPEIATRRKAGYGVSCLQNKSSSGRPLSPGAIALMLMLCLSWGFNQIAVKLALPEIPPMLQAMIRSAGALPVMLIIGWSRGVKFFERDGTLGPGLFAGLLFGLEFVLIFRGLLLTSASRAVVFLYTAPFFVALGSYQFLGERLSGSQWAGLALSFAGVALAIGVPQPNVDASVLLGDLMVVGGGALWAATTLVAKADGAAAGGAGKGDGIPGGAVDPDSGVRGMDFGRNHCPGSRAAGAVFDGLSGVLGGRIDLYAVVCAGEGLFRQQIVGFYLYHPFVWRGG